MSLPNNSISLTPIRKDKVIGRALAVVQKIMFDRFSLVAETKDEIRWSVMGIVFHHMPKDWHVADCDQRFRHILRMILSLIPRPPQKSTTFIKGHPFRVTGLLIHHRVIHVPLGTTQRMKMIACRCRRPMTSGRSVSSASSLYRVGPEYSKGTLSVAPAVGKHA